MDDVSPLRTETFGFGSTSSWWGIVAFVIVLAVVETIAVLALSAWLLPSVVATLINGLVFVFTLAIISASASPLRATMRVRDDVLAIRFGVLAMFTVPLSSVRDATPSDVSASDVQSIGVDFDRESKCVRLMRSSSPSFLRLNLSKPVRGRVLHRSVVAEGFVLGVDRANQAARVVSSRIALD